MVVITDDREQPFVTDDDSSSFVTEEDGSDVESDANSELEEDAEFEQALAKWRPEDETLADRIYALQDILSPSTRAKLVQAWRKSSTWAFWGGKIAGNAVWVITTSALLVGLPLALAIENETMMVQQEKEMLAQQQGAQQMMGGAAPAGQGQDAGLRPPGF